MSGLGNEDSPDGETLIKRFKKEKFPEILVSVNMLDTGFDCPEVVNLVFARFTKSAILYQQMRGRGTRKSKGKPLFTMFDFVGVSDYHGDDDAVGEGGVVVQAAAKTGAAAQLLVVDVEDHIDPMTRAWVTVDEDGRLVFPQASEAKAEALGARFEAWLLTQDGLTPIRRGGWGSSVVKFAQTPIPGRKSRRVTLPLRLFPDGRCGSGHTAIWRRERPGHMLKSLNSFVFADPMFAEARDTRKTIRTAIVRYPSELTRLGRDRRVRLMPLTADMRRQIDQIRDYLFGGGYPNPMANAEQLSFLFFFYLIEGIDAENAQRAKVLKQPYESVFAGEWELKNPLNAPVRGQTSIPKDRFRWSVWARGLSGEALVRFVQDEVFAFFEEIATRSATNFMRGARLNITEPTVLTQVVTLVDGLKLDREDSDTKGDLFEYVLKQIKQAGELGQFRTPRHIIRAIVEMIDPKIGETVYDPAAGTAGFLVAAYNHIRLANSSPAGIHDADIDGKVLRRGIGDKLSSAQSSTLQSKTFYRE